MHIGIHFAYMTIGWSLIWVSPSPTPSRLQMAHYTKQLYVTNYVVTVIIFFCNWCSNIGIYKYIPHGSIWINLCCVRRSINHLFDLVYHWVFLNIVLNGDINDCLYNTLWQSSQLLLFCCLAPPHLHLNFFLHAIINISKRDQINAISLCSKKLLLRVSAQWNLQEIK